MRRLGASLLAAGLAVAVQLLAVTPAYAGTPDVTWTTPASNQVLTTGAFTFQATVRTSSGTLVGNVDVTVSSMQGHGQTVFDPVPTNNQQQVTVTRPLTLSWNGTYHTALRAAGKTDILDNDTTPRESTNDFTVDALPVTPGNVKATADSKTRVVTVSWSPNPEPDMVGYEVQKQSSSGEWKAFAVTDQTSVTDGSTANKGGTYRYQVRALRQSAQAGQLNPSPFSSPASASVPAPPVQTTPTTQPPAGGGGSGGGGEGEGEGEGGTTTTETGGGGSTGGGNGSATETGRSSTGGWSSGPLLATTGKVDLSDFAALLAQQKGEQSRGGENPAVEDDGTFDETLPFKARTAGDDEGDDATQTLGEEPASDDNGNRQAMGFLAGGLLATVLAMHVLWVRSEVHRAEALEILVIEPERPEARRRRRPSPTAP